ncbi:mannosyltransferase [Metarhizium album ARSEF 1941]|uniref:Alpha-1,3/1,6-mannosyltransferase ALG2 n=1 Tax=Metarhizium album (strain ARSEF 1941) TaxID=1081103 RepID=A0A0B2WRA1_METAS|nr:mannosyltransferase [Metarhizium album ARSEF 1941]KHN95505.1 mannosyltransferase [Metarhizium album ARSEF 1941]
MDASKSDPPPSHIGTGTDAVANTIVFFHPDLGIGGAERLVVDAAVSLQTRGHKVVIFTNHCDPTHCFDECRNGTLDVRVRGNSIVPPSILSRLTILCAILRHVHLLLTIHLTGELLALAPRAFIVDQLSAGLPLLRLLAPNVPVLFYCHFPDLLLAQGRQSVVKRLYRTPFDRLEEWSMAFAHAVAVNSKFTSAIVARTWPGLPDKVPIKVVYPCVDTDNKAVGDEHHLTVGTQGKHIILSINRFERKKDIGLAIKAFARIPAKQRQDARLVLAGGYDPRLSENVVYHAELQALATSLSLPHHTVTPSRLSAVAQLPSAPPDTQVLFLLSIPNTLKSALLRAARLLVYTPTNEHFGIVPLEAMLSRVPVLAANTGGPVETVADPQTGWLRDPVDVPAWTDVMARCLALPDHQLAAMGVAGERRVRALFGRDQMAQTLDETLDQIARLAKEHQPMYYNDGTSLRFLAVFVALSAVSAAWFAFAS